MQIFYGEKDIDYNNPNGYAFLNWRFDDSMGGNNKENPFQGISDNFEMGKAYMANAVIALYSIIYSHNPQNMADTMVFPVLFSVNALLGCHDLDLSCCREIAGVAVIECSQ